MTIMKFIRIVFDMNRERKNSYKKAVIELQHALSIALSTNNIAVASR